MPHELNEDFIYFRPSLVVFIDKVGEDIRKYLWPDTLLAYLDPSLRQSVGLIQYPVKGDKAQSWFVRDMFEDTMKIDGRRQPYEDVLEDAVRKMLEEVQSEVSLQNIQRAGYHISNPHTQIYIVGDAASPWMSQVLQSVREQLLNASINTEVCYVLSRYRPGQGGSNGWVQRKDWEKREVANFCFIYENTMRPYTGFLTPQQSYYATAEAIVAMIATGITTQYPYEQAMDVTPTLNSYDQVGNLSTSLIMFPRASVLCFCSAVLGTELLDEWIDDIARSITTDKERMRRQEQARKDVNDIEQWIKDSEIRPGTELLYGQLQSKSLNDDKSRREIKAIRWPNLSILRRPDPSYSNRELQDQEGMHERLQDQTLALFELFSHKSVNSEHKEHRYTAETWADIAYNRSGTASNTFVNWNTQATFAWRAASERTRAGIQRIVDRIWPNSNNGLELARVYIDEYEDQLAGLANKFSVWRKTHQDDYNEALSNFEHLANGEWVTTDDQSSISGSGNPNSGGQAAPSGASTGHPADQISGTTQPFTSSINSGQPSRPLTSLHQHLPDRENQIARRLGQRITWEQSRVPKTVNLLASGVLAIPAILLTLLALLPSLATNPRVVLAICAGLVGLVCLGSWLFHWLYQRNVVKTQKDLLKFYGRYYAHRCEQREDQLRLVVLSPLRIRVQRMRERLDNMGSFITEVSNSLERMAYQAHDDLFIHNPAAIRDVFVGNGAPLLPTHRPMRTVQEDPETLRLRRIEKRTRNGNIVAGQFRRQPTNTLEDFAEQIHGKRLNQPKQPEHHPTELRGALLRSFQNQPKSFIEMTLEETQQHVYDFSQKVTEQYLEGALVDIGSALDLAETWNYAFDRMERPVYRSQVGSPAPEWVLICGRKPDFQRGRLHIEKKQRDAIRVNTENPDWLLVAGFFRDNSPAFLDVDLLFPPKGQPSSTGKTTSP